MLRRAGRCEARLRSSLHGVVRLVPRVARTVSSWVGRIFRTNVRVARAVGGSLSCGFCRSRIMIVISARMLLSCVIMTTFRIVCRNIRPIWVVWSIGVARSIWIRRSVRIGWSLWVGRSFGATWFFRIILRI